MLHSCYLLQLHFHTINDLADLLTAASMFSVVLNLFRKKAPHNMEGNYLRTMHLLNTNLQHYHCTACEPPTVLKEVILSWRSMKSTSASSCITYTLTFLQYNLAQMLRLYCRSVLFCLSVLFCTVLLCTTVLCFTVIYVLFCAVLCFCYFFWFFV
jgi:hypothetical protein